MTTVAIPGLANALEERVASVGPDQPETSPGFALGVWQNGEPVATIGRGLANLELPAPITPGTVFHVASVSKQFTAYGVARLITEGALALDDDVRRFVPELPAYGEPIRIDHLIHHTSGLRDDLWVQDFAGWADDAWISEADALDLICRQRDLSFPTGSTWFYSNAGYTLLAVIIERLSGLPFAEFAHQRIFAPLGMRQSRFARAKGEIVPNRAAAYDRLPDGTYRTLAPEVGRSGAIGLLTTIEDSGRWQAHLQAQISQSSSLGNLINTPGTLANGDPVPYAWGFFTTPHRNLRTLRHGGSHGGYRAHVLLLPDQQCSVACFSNYSDAPPKDICDAVIDLVLGTTEPSPAPSVHTAAGPATQEAPRLGLYHEAGWGAWLHLRREGTTLILDDTDPRPLSKRDDGHYVAAPGGIPVRLTAVPAAGSVPAHLLVWHGSDHEPDRYLPAPLSSLTTADLIAYAGSYWSDELGTLYTIALTPDQRHLRLIRQRQQPVTLTPTGDDCFAFGFFVSQVTLTFARRPDGSVSGFSLSSLRTRNIQFSRAPFVDDRPGANARA